MFESKDAVASRRTVDQLHEYAATLSGIEQEGLREMQVPARDGLTGQAFDGSIDSAADDAKLRQANT